MSADFEPTLIAVPWRYVNLLHAKQWSLGAACCIVGGEFHGTVGTIAKLRDDWVFVREQPRPSWIDTDGDDDNKPWRQ